MDADRLTERILARCDEAAGCSEEPGRITRRYLCPAMTDLHRRMSEWMRAAGLAVWRDAAGNLRGRFPADADRAAPAVFVGSHLDTVPDAGRYDGVLGVLLGIAAVEALDGWRPTVPIEVIAFAEEEGVRYRISCLGSRALVGRFPFEVLDWPDAVGVTVADAMRAFGLAPDRLADAAVAPGQILGYIEAHIEQGPVLDTLHLPLAVVEGIVGQTRLWLRFDGHAGHAGTLPMALRRDALTTAAETALAVERLARQTPGLVATAGSLCVEPGAVNVVPGVARLSLDIRHLDDAIRGQAEREALTAAEAAAASRGVRLTVEQAERRHATPADPGLMGQLAEAVAEAGYPVHRMPSGAGHDAMIVGEVAPMAMLFLRSPGGVSHHPAEAVHRDDVRAALEVVVRLLRRVAA